MNSLQEIIGDAPAFIDEILAEVTAEGFDLSDFSQMDHICYRTTSIEHYQEKAAQLATVASLLGESIINNRPISTFRLHEPIVHSGWRVDAVELQTNRLKPA
jgi:predicted metalloenzyme YecM